MSYADPDLDYERYNEPPPLGSIGNKFSPYDGLTDEEAEQFKKELERREARYTQIGFHTPGTHFYRGRIVKDRRKK